MESGTPKKTKKLQIDSQHGTKDSNIDAQAEPRTKNDNSRYGLWRAELELWQSINSPTAHE